MAKNDVQVARDPVKIGDILNSRRAFLDASVERVGRIFPLSEAAIQQLEKGNGEMSVSALIEYAEALGLRIALIPNHLVPPLQLAASKMKTPPRLPDDADDLTMDELQNADVSDRYPS